MTLSTRLPLLRKSEKTLKQHGVSDGTPNDGRGLWPLAPSLRMFCQALEPYYLAPWSPPKHASSGYYPPVQTQHFEPREGFILLPAGLFVARMLSPVSCPGLGLIAPPLSTESWKSGAAIGSQFSAHDVKPKAGVSYR